MSSKESIHCLFKKYNIPYKKSDSYEKLASKYEKFKKPKFGLDEMRNQYRADWNTTSSNIHFKNLKSGILRGHNWHGAMPSMLHLSMQNKVRECIKGNFSINKLLSIGKDIMKQEYFMVAVHDICESKLVESFPDVIPPVRLKSISDFVFKGIPYDLKITNYLLGHSKKYISSNKNKVATELFKNADIERIRKQANKTFRNWGLNRFYVLVENLDRWLDEPENLLNEFIKASKKLDKPLSIKIDGIKFSFQMVAL